MAGLIPNQTQDLIPTVNVGTTDFMDPTGRVQVKQPNHEPMARAALYFQQKQNEAKIERARGDLERYITESTYGVPGEDGKPQGGWRQLLGENACIPDQEGKGLAQRVDEGLEAAKRQYTQGFTPEMLKQFEDRYYINRRNQVYNSASAFVLEQNNAWKKSSAEGNIAIGVNGMIKSINDPASFEANQKLADSNAYFYAREFLGLDEAAAQVYAREQVSKGVAGAITNILADIQNDPRGIADAQRLLKEHGDLMTASDLVRTRNLVDQEANKIDATNSADRITRSLTRDVQIFGHNGMPPYKLGTAEHAFSVCVLGIEGGKQLDEKTGQTIVGTYKDKTRPKDVRKWAYGAAQMQVPTAEETAKRNGIAWDKNKFMLDRDYNIQLGLLHYNYLVRHYKGDVETAAIAYHAGEGAVDEAIRKAEKNGGHYIDYLGQHSKDYLVDFRERYNASILKSGKGQGSVFDPESFQKYGSYYTRKDVEDRVIAMDPRATYDIGYRNAMTDRVFHQVELKRQDDARERQNGCADIMNWAYEHKWELDQLPAQLKNRVTPSDFMEISQKVKALRDGDESGDKALYNKYITNDKALLELDEPAFQNLYYAVPGKYRQALKDRRDILKEKAAMSQQQWALNVRDAQRGQYRPEFEVSTERLTQAMKMVYGAKEWAGLDENKRMDMLGSCLAYVTQQLQLQNVQGKEVGALKLNDMVKGFFDHEYDTNNVIRKDSKKTFAELSAADTKGTNRGNLYAIGKQLATLERQRRGAPNVEPSENEVYMALVNLDTMKVTNLQGFSFDGFSKPRMDYVRDSFRKAFHRDPDPLEMVKWYARSLWKKEKVPGEVSESTKTPLNNAFDRIRDR